MNKLKSMFIGIYPMLAMAAAGFSVYLQVNNGFSLAWTGVLLTTAPMMLVIMWLLMFKTIARTSEHFPFISLLVITGLGITSFEYLQASQQHQQALLFSIFGTLTFFVYNFWYSSLGRKTSRILSKGNQLPNFEVLSTGSKVVSSESFLGNQNIIVFFRGNWCPLCMAQIKELVSQYEQLDALGAKVRFISPQPESNTVKLSKKHGLNLKFYTDKGNKAAHKLSIEMKSGLPMGMEMFGYDSDTVLPTVIITDKNGFILYSDETNNYRIRPEPQEFIKVLKMQSASA